MFERLLDAGAQTVAALADLVLPTDCAGCGAAQTRTSLCAACAGALAAPPRWTRPSPAPPGFPPCVTRGEYAGPVRAALLAYKERGRRVLRAALGDALAGAVLAGAVRCHARARPDGPVTLVPVPSTAAAVRARHGDHMLWLARRAARRMRQLGWPATVATPVRVRRKQDSAGLDRKARARAAVESFAVDRVGAVRMVADGGLVVVVDDVVTTGATLAAVTTRLVEAGIAVAFAATIAATRLRKRHMGPVHAAVDLWWTSRSTGMTGRR